MTVLTMLGGEYRMVFNMRGIKDISHHKVFRYFSALQHTLVGCKYHFSRQVRCDHNTFSVRHAKDLTKSYLEIPCTRVGENLEFHGNLIFQ